VLPVLHWYSTKGGSKLPSLDVHPTIGTADLRQPLQMNRFTSNSNSSNLQVCTRSSGWWPWALTSRSCW